MPLRPVHDERRRRRCGSRVDLAGPHAAAAVRGASQVGRVTLVLLDTNIPENPPDLQDVTDELYGGDSEMRIRQEIVLGIGGVRALARARPHARASST